MRTTFRTARKRRGCDSCDLWIESEEQYLEHVAAPGHEDLGNTRWWRMRECEMCARRYGRGAQFDGEGGG